jgi:alpha-glucosidase (family GH31 glycosyl hydrolase)
MSAATSVLMTDPAIAYLPGQNYEPYNLGTQLDLWLKTPNGSASLGVVWPGMFRSATMTKQVLKRVFIQASRFSLVRVINMKT